MASVVQVSIPRSVNDPAYRYRMPVLVQKIEGRGINTHTTLVNLKDVAKSLRVPTLYILKFMQYDWGAQIIYKTNNNEVHTSINGIQEEEKVLKSLDNFIDRFVLCPQCQLPEIYYVVEGICVTVQCNSCGAKSKLDSKHKLTTYIAKNPPQNLSDIRIQTEQAGFEGEKRIEESKEVQELRRKLRADIDSSTFNPHDADASSVFELARQYLNAVLPITDAYEFDDSHTEIVYKALKRLRLRKAYYDRVPFLLFQYVFSQRLIKEVETRAILFETVLQRHKMEDYIAHEVVLNLAFFFYHVHETPLKRGYVPTVMKLFFEENLLSEAFLEEWKSSHHDSFFRTHVLFREEDNSKLVADSEEFLNWLKAEEEDELT